MFNRTILFSLLFALTLTAVPVCAEKPTSVAGKIGAGLLQLVHRHAYLTTIPLVLFAAKKLHSPKRALDLFDLGLGLFGWYCTANVTKSVTKIFMDQFDIEPVKE